MLTADTRFLHERAEQLAIVSLTRRADIAVERQPQSFRLDLLASLLDQGRKTGRVFGIEVKAIDADRVQANGALQKSSKTDMAPLRDVPFPVCLFVFTLRDDTGYWRWLREPDMASPQRRALNDGLDETLSPLTDTALAEIIHRIQEWYRSENTPRHESERPW